VPNATAAARHTFSKVLAIVTLYRKYTMALTFEKLQGHQLLHPYGPLLVQQINTD
jgi:hypothetical protein